MTLAIQGLEFSTSELLRKFPFAFGVENSKP